MLAHKTARMAQEQQFSASGACSVNYNSPMDRVETLREQASILRSLAISFEGHALRENLLYVAKRWPTRPNARSQSASRSRTAPPRTAPTPLQNHSGDPSRHPRSSPRCSPRPPPRSLCAHVSTTRASGAAMTSLLALLLFLHACGCFVHQLVLLLSSELSDVTSASPHANRSTNAFETLTSMK